MQPQLISATLHRHTDRHIEQRRATRGSQASRALPIGEFRLSHLTAPCCFSALLQSLLNNADIAIQSSLTELLLIHYY